jgi:hypothetical protein
MAVTRTDVSQEPVASIISVTRISELRTLAVTGSQSADSFHPDDGGDMFFRNVGSFKSHTA